MKRIVHFSLANAKGGITQYVLNNWKYIDKSRFHFDVVTFGGKLDFQDRLEADRCKIFYVKNRAEENLEAFQNEIKQIFLQGYDAVHLHTNYWKSFELEKLAKQADIPKIIVHAHNTGVFDDKERKEKESRHYSMFAELTPDIATDFWACSKVAAKWLYGDKIPEKRIRILHNAVDVEIFRFKYQIREKYRKQLGWEDNFIIGHVGRFSYQKNHEFLIQAFKAIARKNERARLLLIGKGPLEDSISSLVERNGLADKVYFAGTREDVNSWFQAMDVFVLPSRFEGLPIVAVEAQASGVPCLVSDTITRETRITDRIEFLPLKMETWCDRLLLTEKDVGDRERYADQVRKSGYDIKEYIKVLESLYESE